MGIILSALAAAGDAGVQSMNQNIEAQNKSDLSAQESRQQFSNLNQLEQNKLEMQAAAMESLRQNRTAAIGGIIQQNATDQASQPFNQATTAAVADESAGANLPADYYDAIAQQKTDAVQAAVQKAQADPMAGAEAQAQYSGDYGALASQSNKMEIAQMNNAMREAMNNNRYDTLFQIAQMKGDFSMQMKAMSSAKDGTDNVMAHTVFNSSEQAIRDNNKTIDQIGRELADAGISPTKSGKPNPAYQIRQDTINNLRNENKQYRQRQEDMAEKFGFSMPALRPVDDSDASPVVAPAPAKPFNPADFQK
jgi:hypothetical protein